VPLFGALIAGLMLLGVKGFLGGTNLEDQTKVSRAWWSRPHAQPEPPCSPTAQECCRKCCDSGGGEYISDDGG
jgi:hypothetical protein